MYRNRLLSYLTWRYFLRQPKIRRVITRILIRNRDEWIRLLGAQLYINRRKEIGYWRASRQQHGNVVFRDEMPTLTRILPVIAYASTFVDCGANVGLFTSAVLPLKRLFPHLQFYAFEPNPDTCARLRNTLAGTGVRIEDTALSNANGFLEMASGATSGVFGVPGGSFQGNGRLFKVPCRRLDSYEIDGDHIFLKIDVEGHELEVLEGADCLFRAHRILAVFIDGASKERECLQFLRSRGFSTRNAHSLETYTVGDFRLLALCDGFFTLSRQYEERRI